MTTEESLKKLEELKLYSKTKDDWILRVSHIITEPTCPVCSIYPERDKTNKYTAFGNTIEEAVEAAVALVVKDLGNQNVE